jgi:hypothetical protein
VNAARAAVEQRGRDAVPPQDLDGGVQGAALSNRAKIDAQVAPPETHGAGNRIEMQMPPADR